MYTAKITNKEMVDNRLQVTVEFSDGTHTLSETISPQDKDGFKHWVGARLASLETSKELQEEDNLNKEVVVEDPVVPPTADELATREWFRNFGKMQEVGKLVDLGVFTGNEVAITTLRNKLKNDFKPAYLDLM